MKMFPLKFPLHHAALLFVAFAVLAAPQPGFAIAIPSPNPNPTSSPTIAPPSLVLRYGSSLEFTLDKTMSSAKLQHGDLIPISLVKPIILGGVTVAPSGAHASLRVIDARHAAAGDVQGYFDVEVTSLTLADGQLLPLLNDRSHFANRDTNGHESTVGVEDTVGSMTLPFYGVFAALRRGREVTYPAGTKIAARIGATLSVDNAGHPVIALPSPPPVAVTTPSPAFPVAPIYTPTPPPTPKPTPTPTASP